MQMDEAGFRRIVADALKALSRQVDELDTDDLDWKLSDGVFVIEWESGGVFVLSQQVPVRELWLSAFSRAWHFRWADGAWRERDSAQPLEAVLSELFSRKMERPVRLHDGAGPGTRGPAA